jgi:Mrp family chromosome partitioning ATPase
MPPSPGPTRSRGLLAAAISALLVWLGFVAYVWGRPITYEAQSRLFVSSSSARWDARTLARALDTAVFDAEFLHTLAAAQGRTAGREPEVDIRIEPAGDNTFSISCHDTKAQRAADICNQVARVAVQRAPSLLGPSSSTSPDLGAAVRRLAELATAHPALTATAPAPSAAPAALKERFSSEIDAVRQAAMTRSSTALSAAATARVEALARPGTPLGLGPERTLWIGGLLGLSVGLFVFVASGRAPRSAPRPVDDVPEEEPPFGSTTAATRAAEPPRHASPASPVPTRPPSSYPPPSVSPSNAPPPAPSSTPPPAPSSRPPAARSPSSAPPPPPAVVTPEPGEAVVAPTEKQKPDTILPPEPAKAEPPEPHVTVTYEAMNLESRRRAQGIPITRTTQIMGSQAPPSDGPTSVAPLRVKAGSVTTRYSFVSTPPPAGGDPVKPEEVEPGWAPGADLDPAPCAPLCREIYTYGVEHCFVIGVTSVPGVEPEKSEFSGSLALALSATGHARVLLMEANLDTPAQHYLMNAEMPAGATLSRQLQARMTRQGPEYWRVLRCTKSLHLLVDGAESTPGLILSRTFEECVRAMRAYYDFIILDGPSGSRESECRALDGVIDGLIVICTEDHRAEIAATSRLFTSKRFSKAIRANTGT